MLTRIVTAIIAIALFIGVVYFLPPICFAIAVSIVCIIIAYELTELSGIVKVRVLSIGACAFAALMPFFIFYNLSAAFVFGLIFLCVATFFTMWVFSYGKTNLTMVLMSFFAGIVLPLLFSMILKIYFAENGKLWILLPFLAAWMTDTGAYFVGVFFGKHKLCEKISPKKTIEGAIGGVFFCVISLLCFAHFVKLDANYFVLLIGTVLLSVLAQIGDLSFSVIKREYNIKDYGKIMPGHGGLLDRFDSTMFTIPASYILLKIIGGII